MLELAPLVNKYAQAYVLEFGDQLTQESQEIMQALIELFSNNRALLFFFKLPSSFQTQQRIFLQKLKEKDALDKTLEKLAFLLMKEERLFLLPEIVKKIMVLIKQQKGLVDGTVESSHELSSSQKQTIQHFVEYEIGKKVKLTFIINDDLIAGLRINVGFKQWEHSIAQQLTTIERSLSNGD